MNERQQEAVDCLDGPLLLLAGAGTGKTTVIVRRIQNLVTHGVEPHAILAVTFTNKAAREMRERVGKLLGPQAANAMTISTFHSFCVQVLRRHIAKLGYSRNFSIASESYQQGLVVEVMNQLGQVGQGYDAQLWRGRISRAKGNCQWPEDVAEADYPRCGEVAAAYAEYQKRMKQMDLLDFDDLLLLTVKLWREFPEVLAAYRERYRRLMIDEYQDTNAVQLQLMILLAGKEGNLCVVGDDDQSIYSWRGADIENILHFDRVYPQAKVIRLEHNYRSTNTILKAANALIAHNRERHVKNLWSDREDGEPILAVRCEDENAEAAFLVQSVQEAHRDQRRDWRDFAVLYRSNRQSRVLEEAFRKARVPYRVVGSTSFYQTKEILDAGAFLQAAANPANDLAFLRIVNVPPRGIGDTTIEKLRAAREARHRPIQVLAADPEVQRDLPPESASALRSFTGILREFRGRFQRPGAMHDLVQEFFTRLGYLDGMARMYKPLENALARRDNVMELLSAIAEYDQQSRGAGTLEGLIDSFSLKDGNDAVSEKRVADENQVTLMTVHAAKGLEFPVVYVAGMERDLFPHARALEEGNEAEERRLCYVAITRAQKRLYLTYAMKRREGRAMLPHPPSKFLDELPEGLVKFVKPEDTYARIEIADAAKFFFG